MTYLNEGDYALIPDPGYPTYSAAVNLAGAQSLVYELESINNWQPDFNQLKVQVAEKNKTGTGKCKLMFVNYPHMPTGQLPDKTLFHNLIQFAKEQSLLLVHDNPYSFILNDHPVSLMASPGAKEVALELNSLSKSHNMAGWRVGMLVGDQRRINEVLKFKSNMDSGMFLPIQLAAAKALSLDKDWHESVNQIYRSRQKKVFELLTLLNCSFGNRQAGMFVWAAIPSGDKDGYELSDRVLHNARVFITPGGIFGKNGNAYVRVSLCCSIEKIEEAINRIKENL